jgi:type I restriction enzyme, S subunit
MAVWSTVKFSALSSDLRIDAEYYRPDVLMLRRAVSESPWSVETVESLSDSVINFGAYSLCNEIVFQDYEERDVNAVEFVTAQDIQDGFIDHANARWIPATQHTGLLWKSCVKKGQVLVAMAARLGHAAVFDEDTPLNSSQDVAKISVRNPEEVDPHYLAIYINSSVGRNLLLASQTGSVQQHTNLGRIKAIPVVKLPREYQLRTATAYRKAAKKQKESVSIMIEAETQLMKALELDHLNLNPEKSYIRNFHDLQTGNRFGAEYYMPCKQRVLDALAKLPHRSIADHAPGIRDMWDPKWASRSEKVRNFDVTDALKPFLDDTTEPQSSEEIGSAKKRFRTGDVVISRLRSYLKEVAVVITSNTFPSVGSSEFIVLRPTGDGLSAETLMVFLRCSLVQTVLKWSQDGSNHPRFAEEDLLAIPVPDAVLSAQKKIDALVHEATDARREAARLLSEAKKSVEDLISGQSGESRQ